MSDLCVYELEDNVWDEFGDSDDHIVPRSGDGCWDQFIVHGDRRKKRRNEAVGVDSSADNVTKYGISGDEKGGLLSLTKDTMLEKSSWSQTTDGAFPMCDNDQHKESITCDPSPLSSHGLQNGHIDSVGTQFCAGDASLVDKHAAEDNNVYCYPLSHISQSGDDLSFFNNEREDKESCDLLYFGWPDIGNFEDVDRMFRSCDSTFGLGLSNEDDLCWFSTPHAAEGSEDALKQAAKLNGQEYHGISRPENAGLDDSKQKNMFNSDQKSTSGDNGDHHAESKSKDELMTIEQISSHLKQSKRGHSVQKEYRCLENVGSFDHYNNIKQLADVKQPHGDSSCEVFSSSGFQHHKQDAVPDSISYMQTDIPCMNLSYSSSSDQISMCATQSVINSENNGHPSYAKESSYASNNIPSMESSLGPSFVAPTMISNEKKGKLHHPQDIRRSFNRNFGHVNMESQVIFHDPVIVQKQIHQSEQEEGHSEVEGVSIEVPAELDSSNAQESSCVSSVWDEISLEATSFRQLQQVMEKLDIRTKLCIRDSLYRLARSAEQRHNCANAESGNKDDRDSSGLLMAEDTNKCTGFMDMETDTNPIDRSIAHLLFHRPTDPSNDSLRPHVVAHGSITSSPVMAEKLVSQEEIGGVLEKEMLKKDSK